MWRTPLLMGPDRADMAALRERARKHRCASAMRGLAMFVPPICRRSWETRRDA